MFLNCLPQLIIVFVGGGQLMPAYEATNQEIHIFRWAIGPDLNNTRCAIVVAPPRNPNTTWEALFWSGAYKFLFYPNCSPDECREACQHNSTIFVLIGNPGIIWHPETDQCVHTQIYTVPSISLDDDPERYRTLSTSYDCERDSPNLAFFKYDNDNPRRLSFLGDFNNKTGQREELCIRNYLSMSIQVASTCTDPPRYSDYELYAAYFHEIV